MLRRMLCLTFCIGALAGTTLLSGCGNGIDKSGPPTPPQKMDDAKKKQMEDFFKSRGGNGPKPGTGVVPPPHG